MCVCLFREKHCELLRANKILSEIVSKNFFVTYFLEISECVYCARNTGKL